MQHRSRTDIVREILEASRDGVNKTKIMYKAYLSYAQLKEYLEVMVANELLIYEPTKKEYKATERGSKFLRIHEEMTNLDNDVQIKA
jgi:predicted transcriptional regulator